MHDGWMNATGWMHGGSWIWVLILILIGIVIWFAVRAGINKERRPRSAGAERRATDPEAVLEKRFAKGEIDEKEFHARRKALRDRG